MALDIAGIGIFEKKNCAIVRHRGTLQVFGIGEK